MRERSDFSESVSLSLREAFNSQISLGRHEFLMVDINCDRIEEAARNNCCKTYGGVDRSLYRLILNFCNYKGRGCDL
jgi:hypothetical protein